MKTETIPTSPNAPVSNLVHTTGWKYFDGNRRIRATIRLNDQCRNGHEDFAITGETKINLKGCWREDSCGCIHDEILKMWPEFEPFVNLHLSDWNGYPMHCAANGFYHFREGRMDHLKCHLTADDSHIEAIQAAMPRTEKEFSYVLEQLGFRARFKNQAALAIAQLEKLTGQKFESQATRTQWPELTAEDIALIEERKASGYYEPAAIAARDAEKKEAERQKKITGIKADFEKQFLKLENQQKVKLYFAERGINDDNIIYYDHTNQLVFNWKNERGYEAYCKTWTQEEFIDILNEADYSALPEGVELCLGHPPRKKPVPASAEPDPSGRTRKVVLV